MDTHSEKCPNCNKTGVVQLLSTTNEWKWYCTYCDIRFNDKKQIMEPFSKLFKPGLAKDLLDDIKDCG